MRIEKRGKRMVSRAEKLARAQQLVSPYVAEPEPAQVTPKIVGSERMNVLFVCSRNQWRSPTADRVWRNSPQLSTRSAGTSPNARHPVSEVDLRWADTILVMEHKHKSRLMAQWPRLLAGKAIHVLDIPDEYQYMDPELVTELKRSVAAILALA